MYLPQRTKEAQFDKVLWGCRQSRPVASHSGGTGPVSAACFLSLSESVLPGARLPLCVSVDGEQSPSHHGAKGFPFSCLSKCLANRNEGTMKRIRPSVQIHTPFALLWKTRGSLETKTHPTTADDDGFAVSGGSQAVRRRSHPHNQKETKPRSKRDQTRKTKKRGMKTKTESVW